MPERSLRRKPVGEVTTMIPVKEYQILSGDSKGGLLLKVERAIGVGWQPTGGVAVAVIPELDDGNEPADFNMEYCQAMVR